MEKLIRKLPRLLSMSVLIFCIALSYFATFSGLYDLLAAHSNKLTLWHLIVAALLSYVIIIPIILCAKKWWKTRKIIYLVITLFCFAFSFTFAFGFYFKILGLDQKYAENIYSEKRNSIVHAIDSNKATLENLIYETNSLVIHSQQEVAKEAQGIHTCDIMLRGHGPRAAYRQRDAKTFERYKNQFEYKKARYDELHNNLEADDFLTYNISNVKKFNEYIRRVNNISKSFIEDVENLREFLKARVQHNNPGFSELFDNGIFQAYIRCPDDHIGRYEKHLSKIEIAHEIPVVEISDPNRTGVQIIQALRMLMNFSLDNFSEEDLVVVMVAVFLAMVADVLLFFLTLDRPNSSPPTLPPTSSPAWTEFFPDDEYRELIKLVEFDKRGRVHLFMPTSKNSLIAAMAPLISHDLATYKGKVPWWIASLIVPHHIRKQSNSSCFYHYQISVHCVSKWVLDHKNEQRRVANLYGTDKQEPSLHSSSLAKDNTELNGNNLKGVANGIQ